MASNDRLVQYQQQLKQINAILVSAPNDVELLSLKNDIVKLIAITEADLAKSSSSSVVVSSTTTTTLPSSTSSLTISPQLPSSIHSNENITNTQTEPISSLPSSISSIGTNTTTSSSVILSSDIQSNETLALLPYIFRYKVGDRVEGLQLSGAAEGHSAWYPGIVMTLHPDIHQVTVRFIGVPILLHGPQSSDRTVDESILRNLVPPTEIIPEHNIKPGYKFLAKWTVDGAWYTARIDEITNMDHIRVTFLDYGNTEIIPREYLQTLSSTPLSISSTATTTLTAASNTVGLSSLSTSTTVPSITTSSSSSTTGTKRPLGEGSSISGTVTSSSTSTTVTTTTIQNDDNDSDDDDIKGTAAVSFYAELVIPEHLRVLPTDTEADRLRKRRKVKAIKQNYKRTKLEEEAKHKVNSWQSFMASNKRPRSVLQ